MFSDLPKLKKIVFGVFCSSSTLHDYPPIFKNLPNLENAYFEEIDIPYLRYDTNPVAVNINPNAVLHFTTNFGSVHAWKEYYYKYKVAFGFKTIVFK